MSEMTDNRTDKKEIDVKKVISKGSPAILTDFVAEKSSRLIALVNRQTLIHTPTITNSGVKR